MEKSTYEFHGGIKGKHNPIDQVYQELIQLRESNRVLEKRVKTLEKQNIEITRNLDFVGNNEPSRPIMRQKRPKPQQSGYIPDTDQYFYEEVPTALKTRSNAQSLNRNLQKVQSTPQMLDVQSNPSQLSKHIDKMGSIPNYPDSSDQNLMRATQYSKGSMNSYTNSTNSQWLSKRAAQQASLPQDLQSRPQYTRENQDIAAVVPPMPRMSKRSEISPNPTLAMLLRKRK